MASLSLSLAFALVSLLILGLDRSVQGLIEVDQQPMLDLYQSFGKAG